MIVALTWISLFFILVFMLRNQIAQESVENSILWTVWDFTGLRFIWTKTGLPLRWCLITSKNPPATFFLWIIGIYVAFFGLASQRYENRVDIIENRANSIFAQLPVPEIRKYALSRISRVQYMSCPTKPEILKPHTVLLSLFGKDNKYQQIVDDLRETVEDWKEHLAGVVFFKAYLQEANLSEANMQKADFEKANLQSANLQKANLRKAYLVTTNLHNAYLLEADLQEADLEAANLQEAVLGNATLRKASLEDANLNKADLIGADLQGAYLGGTDFKEADLGNANFEDACFWGPDPKRGDLKTAKNLSPGQLSKVKTLYGAKLDPNLEKTMRSEYPHLFEKPEE